MQRRNGFTLVEILVVLSIIAMGCALYLSVPSPVRHSTTITIVRQQAKELQSASEIWVGEQASLADARAAFNSDPAATAPASQVAFFNAALAPELNADLAADVAAHSSSTRLQSSAMADIGAYVTVAWAVNYTQQHITIVVNIP